LRDLYKFMKIFGFLLIFSNISSFFWEIFSIKMCLNYEK